MELDISNSITNEKEQNNETTEFIRELEKEKQKLEIADKNFSRELCKKFKLPMECAEELENKIDEYLKEYSCRCGEVLYAGYDLKTNSYYQDQYLLGEKARFEISKEKAEGWGIGSFYEISYKEPSGDATSSENIDYPIRKAISTSIKEQLQEGIDIKDVDLFKLEDDYKNCGRISKIYKEPEPIQERPEWAKRCNVYL